jgi:hypothetical protein
MVQFPYRLAAALFVVAALAYVAMSFALFEMPATAEAAADCGFLPGEFVSEGKLTYERTQAFWVSFRRKDEIWTAISVGLAVSFIGFALAMARRAGKRAASGAAVGGSVLAVSALCVSCLAPVLSVVGIGLAGTLLAGVPKWLIALNTLMLTGWGTLYLVRRAGNASCALPQADLRAATKAI